MAITSEYSYERATSPRIGTIDHLEAATQIVTESSVSTVRQLQEVLQTNDIPESLAYFIFQYQVRETRRYWTPEKTAVIDTRGLSGYEPHWPDVHAEYHYDPLLFRNYIRAYGYGHHMHISLTDGLELDTSAPLEAHTYFGNTPEATNVRSFRSSVTDPRYDAVRDPSLFVDVLQKTVEDFKRYLHLRDYL